jgi:hypothetical protein
MGDMKQLGNHILADIRSQREKTWRGSIGTNLGIKPSWEEIIGFVDHSRALQVRVMLVRYGLKNIFDAHYEKYKQEIKSQTAQAVEPVDLSQDSRERAYIFALVNNGVGAEWEDESTQNTLRQLWITTVYKEQSKTIAIPLPISGGE